jgi:hypothetical protein
MRRNLDRLHHGTLGEYPSEAGPAGEIGRLLV